MNFEFRSYNVRLTFNPADITIRMEHQENRRLYESTFMTEDFEGLSAIGGLSTFEKILKAAFTDSSAFIEIIEEKIDHVSLKVGVNGIIPMSWTIRICARRRESGDTAVEVEELRERVDVINTEVDQLSDRLFIVILIPGCPVIKDDFNITELNFVDTMVPDVLPFKCPTCVSQKNEQLKIPKEKLSTFNTQPSYPNHIQCAFNHYFPISFIEYIKYINPMPYNLETNTYVVKSLRDLSDGLFDDRVELECLNSLSISIKDGNSMLSNFRNFMKNRLTLKKLTLHCPNLEDIEGIENCKTLEEIDLEGCEKITNINMLAELPALKKLRITNI